MSDNLMSAAAIARAIAEGQTTAVAQCEAAIARIEAANPSLNAVVVKDYDRARDHARAADAAAARGDYLPLLGVPMTIKESFEAQGLPQTWGFADYRDHVSSVDGSTVRALRAAGAVILGKTNVPVALADIQCVNPVYGRTVNPHDPARTCGGSSGGSAAAVASGMVPLEIGTDIGGSVRTPAHFCGVFGHKTSYGIIPLDGHRRPGTDGADRPLSVAGPIARHAPDLALALSVVATQPLPPAGYAGLSGTRLLVMTSHPRARVSAEIADAIAQLADRAADAGATIITASDLMPDLDQLTSDYLRMLNIIVSGGVPLAGQEAVTVRQWFDLCDAQARVQRQCARMFEQVDAVVCPVHGTTAFAHDDTPDMRDRTLVIDGENTAYGAQFAWIALATFAGLPATSAPIGQARDGMPFNIQVICANRRDLDAIAIAGALSDLALGRS